MLSAEGTGRNIEQAIENALFELKATREDVDIKILSEGGLFKKAKVVVTISDDARAKYEKKASAKAKEEKEEKKEIKEAVKTEKKEEKAAAKEAKKEEKEAVKEEAESSKEERVDVEMEAIEFLEGLFKAAGKEVEIKTSEDDKYITYSVEGDDLGDMIGHHGDCYYAINRLLSAVTGKHEKRLLLDIGGYRQKREETLSALAKRTADKVAKSGRYSRLDPMNPSDRRIIHAALADDDRVVTLSKGEDPKRYVMIFPKDEN